MTPCDETTLSVRMASQISGFAQDADHALPYAKAIVFAVSLLDEEHQERIWYEILPNRDY